ncbi:MULTISPECIES: GH36-type glycosyl hydrolase domain-containing protein [unclassified Shinella]|uniref:GH36-type glycosyl hydrolase domain-containing protein n=1 Tax=unclassified Shinella TaxID=2643062 RepID=UPI00225C6B2C|nr:glucoamylase family protein [Shinella sp. YE25]CAI0337301.1 Cyclic beta-(1,2)-glucan synthase NdvB [Rhizobiaceae bacterium]CAK7255795.1 Cyclic beta-(1,2)-glucan synthase NdvB [Shinella sp. WSC3-e]
MAKGQKRGVEDIGSSETAVTERTVHPETGSRPLTEPQAVARGKGKGSIPQSGFGFNRASGMPLNDPTPVREELFGIERLEQHAATLALAQPVTRRPPSVQSLHKRLKSNAAVLLAAYRASALEVENERGVVPAAEWLLDNYHLVEEQIREIHDDLPPNYYRQLPKLAEGPFAGYPRVFGIAWAFVAHTDSHFDPETLVRFITAYQKVQPLTIGELWAVAITLRIVLVENLRRLADQITAGRRMRAEADALADRLLANEGRGNEKVSAGPLPELFAAQLAKRLRDHDPNTTPAHGWLEARLAKQGTFVEAVVRHAQQRQGASNVTVRNIITSMRLIGDVDWADLFEKVSLVDARLSVDGSFARMDFATRNLYRSAIEDLARGSDLSELDIAGLAVKAARTAPVVGNAASQAERVGDPGYHLIAQGRPAFERMVGFRRPRRLMAGRLVAHTGIAGYAGAIGVVTSMSLAVALWLLSATGLSALGMIVFAVLALLPASDIATALVNRFVSWSHGATTLPGLELAQGVPQSSRTLVVVPTLMTSRADLLEQIERLEVHHLSGAGGDLSFALLTDGRDTPQESAEGDGELLALAIETMAELNRRHGPGPAGDRFLLLHRKRRFNAGENVWMGWERKRGKLHELNRLLRGATDTSFMALAGKPPTVPPDVRYVITLDADTKLPRDTVLRLIGKMAHPLNRPRFDAGQQRVVDGYAIIQPRVTPSLPIGREGSLYQRVFSAPGGMDPYAAAVSDVYQDLFGEGSYTGKGIYDVDAFEAALAGRIPDNTLLSHDLFEGTFARAGLASDIEVVDDFPARYDVAARRQHRWTRGDWQLLPWIFGRRALPALGRWKMLDNLRRTLIAPSAFAALVACCAMPLQAGMTGALLIASCLAIPAFLPLAFAILPRRSGLQLSSHAVRLAGDLKLAAMQIGLGLAFLPDQAWRNCDAMLRTASRLLVTRRKLLEWTTAATSGNRTRLTLAGFYRDMAGGTVAALALLAAAVAFSPAAWALAFLLALLWLAAPAIALWVSRSPTARPGKALSDADAVELRLVARRTWRFFETFVTPLENMLPPDNFQETPLPAVAHRTSPTNIGLYFLSTVAARDFGWVGTLEALERLEASFTTLKRLDRFNGHFFNWYDTRDLRTLDPPYVSSVDSGNLAGHLIALANACEEWAEMMPPAENGEGFGDTLALARMALADAPGNHRAVLSSILDEVEILVRGPQSFDAATPALTRLLDKALKLVGPAEGGAVADLVFWIAALRRSAVESARDRQALRDDAAAVKGRLQALAGTARTMALDMDFAFLFDPERKLLSIGYSLADNGLDPNCYDLLASEARLASFFAIAKGDVGTRHWFRLGRAATPLGSGSALISWSGSMFEYLMPSLVMRAPAGSLLDDTNRLIVARQEAYGRSRNVPWGVSESAFNARDMEFTYQYSNFGVPGLGLKRGLSGNMVVAPYATGLAAMVDPHAALDNYRRLEAMGARGVHGFYEALDFTRARLPENARVEIVRSYMAHHQGMTIVAIAVLLQDGRMRARFHREPMIMASELLLSERMPRDVAIARPRAEEVKASAGISLNPAPSVRRLSLPAAGAPVTHLLSNGRYAVMLTASGGGYSRWRDIAVTRWREDATRDDCGAFIFLKDMQAGTVFSPTVAAMGDKADASVVFGEDHAQYIRHDETLTTEMDVIVSGEDDGEVRRIYLTNIGPRAREIELTSYAELVLASAATDNAHPAFAKMFVETEHLAEYGALIATRRRRAPSEAEIWAAHFAVVEGDAIADPQYESDRARFLGRGRSIATAAAIHDGQALSNTAGTVLDPIFALRRSVRVLPGKVARVAFWTIVAGSREELLERIDKHHDKNAFDRAKTLAWTQAQVQLHHLDMDLEEAADFQRLAAPILYADARFRPASDAILAGAGPQSGLWPYGISGDLPIVLLRIEDVEDLPQLRQMLRAHEYWRIKRLAVDLVIVNERAASYVQDLQNAVEAAVRSSQSRPRFGDMPAQGAVHVLRADFLNQDTKNLLNATARVVLSAHRGLIADQLARLSAGIEHSAALPPRFPPTATAETVAQPETLEFFNGLGGFGRNGTEYVTVLENGATTPMPWINVIANPAFGFQVSADGSAYTWAENSRENQITQWSNDPVGDPSGEALYIRDEETLDLWSPTAQPIRDGGRYVACHGFGYSRFSHRAHGIESELLSYVPLADPIRISRLTLTNRSSRPRRLSVTSYAEWVLGTLRGASAPFIATSVDAATGAIFVCNRWAMGFPGRVAFADLGGRQTAWTADRTEFLGRGGSSARPAALGTRMPLGAKVGAGVDPCAALQCTIELDAGESIEIVSFLGQAASVEEAGALIARYRTADLDAVLSEVSAHWQTLLKTVRVKTPDRAMDIMLNGWLLYQTLACRIWARSAFYQASGAYGFRDQLQDGMALAFARPQEARAHILRAAGRQFPEGDMQHWWLPHSGAGVRTRISDDRIWLAFAAATYVGTAGDAAILDEVIPFLEGPALAEGEHDAFFQPAPSGEAASLFEHCARGLDQAVALTGRHGLPQMGTGDWNDGMNRVGEGGEGESVWLGWLLIRTIDLFAPFAEGRDPERAAHWKAHAASLKVSIEREAWDGDWYRRATFDDGAWLGAKDSDECRIDSIAQSWAVLSGAADPARAATAMASLESHLIRKDDGLALLFTPPFDATVRDPGYIKGYPPGLRENGGQYSHAAMWAILAFAKLGDGDKAHDLFTLLNPVNHANTPEAAARYKVEPYVIAADVYSVAPHVGRGGWTWYTGSAAWMYRAGIEGILGLHREGTVLVVEPCMPKSWPQFEVTITMGDTCYDIRIERVADRTDRAPSAILDGSSLPYTGGPIRFPLSGRSHTLLVEV